MFEAPVRRFCDTYRQHSPGADHRVWAVLFGQSETPEIEAIFKGMPVDFIRYDGGGMDIGAAQSCARFLEPDFFTVNFTSRAYFHRPGWLGVLARAREQYGQGLYGLSSSREGGRFHICTRGYSLDAGDFARYPTEIVSRNQGVYFECGEHSLTEWCREQGLRGYVVTFCGVTNWEWTVAELTPEVQSFRVGDQSDMLVWDRHTDIFRDADLDEKRRLYSLMVGNSLSEAPVTL